MLTSKYSPFYATIKKHTKHLVSGQRTEEKKNCDLKQNLIAYATMKCVCVCVLETVYSSKVTWFCFS